jgi:hypothetical protein
MAHASKFEDATASPKSELAQAAGSFRAMNTQVQPSAGHGWQRTKLLAGQWEVYYDGNCGFCRRWAMRASRFSHPKIQWRDFRTAGAEVAHLNPRFGQSAYLVINREVALPGFFAFRKLVLVSPRLWPMLPLAYLPGSGWLGPKIYSWIAQRYGPTNVRASCHLQ